MNAAKLSCCLIGIVLSLAALCPGQVATLRLGHGSPSAAAVLPCQGGEGVVRFDLSAVPKDAKVVRADLVVSRDMPFCYWIEQQEGPEVSYLAAAAPRADCTVDITLRHCKLFTPKAGQKFAWTNVNLRDGKEVQSGEVAADQWGLVTLKDVKVLKGAVEGNSAKAESRIKIARKG